ncbi:MAG: hypothetical protein M1834_005678 [Cirrosporium novae-zelandiae]|nr:MAG: hypothetical protein M1834_005678 [Cirrosporium novae-zelandiae]
MFARKSHKNESFSKYRAGKSSHPHKSKRSFRERSGSAATRHHAEREASKKPDTSPIPASPAFLTSPIITINVGPSRRLFAAHEDVLSLSPYFASQLCDQFFEPHTKRIELPDEQAEIFSAVLEYLYKGDYSPQLVHNKRRDNWELEGQEEGRGGAEPTIVDQETGEDILKDTAVYCAATRFSLPSLSALALRKQGLQTGIQCSTILSSARFAYTNTPDTDSKLRAHYLALIIRSRATFKRSGTMQKEMERGGVLFFDLFVAMCNHMDDITAAAHKSPHF